MHYDATDVARASVRPWYPKGVLAEVAVLYITLADLA